MTEQTTPADSEFFRYLLGRMNAEEEERIEQRYLTDPQFHDELRAAERDLIDRYVYGELPDADEFERHFMSSPGRRERVAFALALRRSLAARPAGAGSVRWSWWPVRTDFSIASLVTPRVDWRLAAAAAVLVVGGWLIWNGRQPDGAPRLAETPPPPAQDAPAAPAPPPEAIPPVPAPIAVATFVLVPNLTRTGDEPPTLTIPRDVDARFRLTLEPGDYRAYRVVIQTADGDEIWRQDGLTIVRSAAGDGLLVTVPRDRLRVPEYIIRVSGVSAGGEAEEVATYYFRVRR